MLFRKRLTPRYRRLSFLVADHLSDGRTVSTIGEERRRNRFFGGVPRESFIARFRTPNAIKS